MFDPLDADISTNNLHIVLFTFPKVVTRIICLTIKNFFVSDNFLYSHNVNVWFGGMIRYNGNRTEWSPIWSVIIQVIKKNSMSMKWESDLLITSMITDRIG